MPRLQKPWKLDMTDRPNAFSTRTPSRVHRHVREARRRAEDEQREAEQRERRRERQQDEAAQNAAIVAVTSGRNA